MSYDPNPYSCSPAEAERVYHDDFTSLAAEDGVAVRPWSDLTDHEQEEFGSRCVSNFSSSPDVYAEWGLRTGDLNALRCDVPGVFAVAVS